MCNCNAEFMSKEYLINQITSLIEEIYTNQRRPFYSEMDFQYNLLLMLEKNKPEGWSIYTEVPYDNEDSEHKRIDICVVKHSTDDQPEKDEIYLIELKYKTEEEAYWNPFWGEEKNLKLHSCYTNNREAFFEDVDKLKNLSDSNTKVKSAFAIFLTNCKNYIENERKTNYFMGIDKDNTCNLKKDGELIAKGEWHEVQYDSFSKEKTEKKEVHFNIVEIPKKLNLGNKKRRNIK